MTVRRCTVDPTLYAVTLWALWLPAGLPVSPADGHHGSLCPVRWLSCSQQVMPESCKQQALPKAPPGHPPQTTGVQNATSASHRSFSSQIQGEPSCCVSALGNYCCNIHEQDSGSTRGRRLGGRWNFRRKTRQNSKEQEPGRCAALTHLVAGSGGLQLTAHGPASGADPYLIPGVDGAPPATSCCHPRNDFCKPATGTGPWQSCL